MMEEEIYHVITSYYDDWFAINKVYNVWAKQNGISQKALFVLFEIYNSNSPCTQRMICERTSYQKQTVSQIIHGLDKQGILHCEIYDSDRRNHIIRLTDEGKMIDPKLLLN